MDFANTYTTTEKIEKIVVPIPSVDAKPEELETIAEIQILKDLEVLKSILSNDSFAIGSMISQLINKIEHARVSLI